MKSFRKLGLTVLLTAFIAIAAVGCGKGSNQNPKIPGVTGPNVNFVNNKVMLSVVLQNVHINGGVQIQVPNMPNSSLQVGPDLQSNGYLIDLALDGNDIKTLAKNSFNVLNPQMLPGGRPLPGIESGELPAMAIEIPQWNNLTLYLSNTVLGAFVHVNLPVNDLISTFRFFDPANAQIGNISIVGKDPQGQNAGFLLLVNLQGKIGQLIGMN